MPLNFCSGKKYYKVIMIKAMEVGERSGHNEFTDKVN